MDSVAGLLIDSSSGRARELRWGIRRLMCARTDSTKFRRARLNFSGGSILDTLQPSLRDLVMLHDGTQDCVLG